MGNKYIHNKHIAPITANARDKKGAVVFTKVFMPERVDATTGRVVSTGYTTLTAEEYKQLNESSKVFSVYRDKYKLLVEHDELPPGAKTPQEALVDAKNKERKLVAQVAVLETEVAALKVKLEAAEKEGKAGKKGSVKGFE
jgi:hypothetical protein